MCAADPSDLEFKLMNVKNKFEKDTTWSALTEYMRFEAEATHEIN